MSLSIIPRIAKAGGIARANARIEIPRSLASFAVPLLVGAFFSRSLAVATFALAAFSALASFGTVIGLPRFPPPRQVRRSVLKMIGEGGAFVLRHSLLLPISLCAVAWNFAFAALLAVAVPLVTERFHADPGTFGIALSAFGLAAVAGTWSAGRLFSILSPNVILLFGPGSSLVAALLLFLLPVGASAYAVYFAFFLLGFGPAMWLIAQNTVRQLVTPAAQLGRVNAVIQTAIYGIRPIGALAGGAVVGALSPRAGVALVLLAFACSFAAALFSGLRSLRGYAELAAEKPA